MAIPNNKLKVKEVSQYSAFDLEFQRMHQLLMSVDEFLFNVSASNFDFSKTTLPGMNPLSMLKAGIQNVYLYLQPLMEEESRENIKGKINAIEEELFRYANKLSNRETAFKIYKQLLEIYEELNDFRKRAGLTIRTSVSARIEKKLENKLLQVREILKEGKI